MTNRDYTFDLIRAIAIIWIVCIWHLTNYYPQQSNFYLLIMNKYGYDITVVILSIFTLLSGLFLGQKKVLNLNDFLLFYKKRATRFYLLFIISCVTLYFTPCHWGNFIEDKEQLLLTMTGLSVFIGKMPSTLWYMDMLLFFYILTPFILYIKNKKIKITASILIYFICFIINHYFHVIENRIVFYMPYYLLGLFVGADNLKFICIKNKTFLIISCIIIISVGQVLTNYYFTYLYNLAGVILLLCLIFCLKIKTEILKAGFIISYASMAMYLFHRQLYAMFWNFGISAYLAIPFILVVSYFIQNGYDISMNYLRKNEK